MRDDPAVARQNAVFGADCFCLALGHVSNFYLLVIQVPGVHDSAVEPQTNERILLIQLRIIKLARDHVLRQITSDDRGNQLAHQ